MPERASTAYRCHTEMPCAAAIRGHGALLIVDDIQMGCGRTGPFFSFEPAGIVPDIICLSKSIGGYGTSMALTLMCPEYDVWRPGEHNGTLRGYNPAFVRAARALEVFWSDGTLQARTTASGEKAGRALTGLAQGYGLPAPRGRGPAWGLPFDRPGAAREVCRAAYRAGLLVETAGPQEEVVKVLPPLTIGYEQSEKGLGILDDAIASTAGRRAVAASSDEREDAPSGPPPLSFSRSCKRAAGLRARHDCCPLSNG